MNTRTQWITGVVMAICALGFFQKIDIPNALLCIIGALVLLPTARPLVEQRIKRELSQNQVIWVSASCLVLAFIIPSNLSREIEEDRKQWKIQAEKEEAKRMEQERIATAEKAKQDAQAQAEEENKKEASAKEEIFEKLTAEADSILRIDTTKALELYEKIIQQYPAEKAKGCFWNVAHYTKDKAKSIDYFQKVYAIDTTDLVPIYNVGIRYLQMNDKAKAIEFFTKAKSKGHKESCYKLREMSQIIVGYNTYLICCDGTRSSAVGRRGACSHHNGVCQTAQEPIYQYTMDCN